MRHQKNSDHTPTTATYTQDEVQQRSAHNTEPSDTSSPHTPWVQRQDPTTGHTYYFNETTHCSQWHRPDEPYPATTQHHAHDDTQQQQRREVPQHQIQEHPQPTTPTIKHDPDEQPRQIAPTTFPIHITSPIHTNTISGNINHETTTLQLKTHVASTLHLHTDSFTLHARHDTAKTPLRDQDTLTSQGITATHNHLHLTITITAAGHTNNHDQHRDNTTPPAPHITQQQVPPPSPSPEPDVGRTLNPTVPLESDDENWERTQSCPADDDEDMPHDTIFNPRPAGDAKTPDPAKGAPTTTTGGGSLNNNPDLQAQEQRTREQKRHLKLQKRQKGQALQRAQQQLRVQHKQEKQQQKANSKKTRQRQKQQRHSATTKNPKKMSKGARKHQHRLRQQGQHNDHQATRPATYDNTGWPKHTTHARGTNHEDWNASQAQHPHQPHDTGTKATPYDRRSTQSTAAHKPIPDSNKGHQMLLRMGWKGAGSGLGREGSGITEPITPGRKHIGTLQRRGDLSLSTKYTSNPNPRSGLGPEHDRLTHETTTEPQHDDTAIPTHPSHQHQPPHTVFHPAPHLNTDWRRFQQQQAQSQHRGHAHTTAPGATTTHRRTVRPRTQTSEDQHRNSPDRNLANTHPPHPSQQHRTPYTMFHPAPHLNTNWMRFLQQQAEPQHSGNTHNTAPGGHPATRPGPPPLNNNWTPSWQHHTQTHRTQHAPTTLSTRHPIPEHRQCPPQQQHNTTHRQPTNTVHR